MAFLPRVHPQNFWHVPLAALVSNYTRYRCVRKGCLSLPGTKLPIAHVSSSVANGGKADDLLSLTQTGHIISPDLILSDRRGPIAGRGGVAVRSTRPAIH